MSIANKLSYLNETKKKLFTNINALGGDLTKDNTFREYALELDNMWENMPHTTGEGSIVILNTKKGKAKVNPFYADDIVQDGTPTPDSSIPIEVGTGRQTIITQGKNLIDTSSITSLTDKGITATFEDGYITLNGTVADSSNAYFYIPVYGLRKGEIVSVSANNESVNNNVYLIYYGENNIMSFTNLSNADMVKANVTLVNNVESFGIQVKGPITLEDFVLRPQLERGSTVTAYELSKGNDICEINLGKNLWKNFNFTKIDGTITWNYYEDGRITVNGYTSKSNNYSIEKTDVDNNNWYINLEPGYYVLSGGKSSARRLEIVDSNGTTIASDIGNSIKFRLLETKKVFVRAYVSNENEIDETFYPQIEKGSTSSSFSSYKEPIELCKTEGNQDKIYKENGKWYLHKKIGKFVLDGTTNMFDGKSSTNRNIMFYTNFLLNIKKPSSDTNLGILMSSHFENKTAQNIYNTDTIGIGIRADGRLNVGFGLSSNISTLTLANQWLNTNNVIIYYVLETPTTEEITDTELIEQLEKAYRLNTYDGITNISVDSANLPIILDVVALSSSDSGDEPT